MDGQDHLQFADTTSNVAGDFLNHKPFCIDTFLSVKKIPYSGISRSKSIYHIFHYF